MTRPHTTHHESCGCCEAERDALKAQVDRLKKWADSASDFLDELWQAFPTESATWYGANVLLNEYKALAERAPEVER